MTKKFRNVLVGICSCMALASTGVSVAFTSDITADAQGTNVFEMVYGAGIRVSDPTGMRFKTKFSENYYEELTKNGTDTQMFVSIFPYADYSKYDTSGQDLAVWLDSYYGQGKYINIAMDPAKFYKVAEDNCYYGNAVISNVYFNNYHREFVGVAYLRRGTEGNYTYEYTTDAITKEDNARSVFEVASKANMDEEDHAKYGDALEKLIENGLYSAYGVSYDKDTGSYSLNGNTYDSIEAVESVVKLDEVTLSLANETLTVGESKQLMPAMTYFDGTVFAKEAFYVWSSSNESVATVNESGEITAVAEGETIITVTACGGLYSATNTVTVSKKESVKTVVIENTLYDPTSPYVGTVTNEVSAPAGFETVHKFTEATSDASAIIHGANYSAKNLTDYSYVTFAMKAPKMLVGGYGWDTSNEWFVFELTQTGEALWTIEVSQNGSVIHTATNMSGNRNDANYAYNALDSILYGVPAPEYYVGAANGALTVYFTEVRGVSTIVEPEEPEEPVKTTIIENTLFDPTSPYVGSATDEVSAPAGFETVHKFTEATSDPNGYIHGGHYSATNLNNYSFVTFAVKTPNIILDAGGWNTSNEWLVFELTQTGEALWTIEVSQNGSVIHTATNMSGDRDGGAYVYNALDSILFGIPGTGYYVGAANGALTVYFTEVRGISTIVEPEVEPVGTIIDNCAYDAVAASFNETTEIEGPAGFEKLYKHVSAGDSIHGMLYSGTNLDNYELVTFALKTANFNMNSEGANESNEWLIFTLTQATPDMWNLVVTCNGETVYTKDGLKGSYDSAANPAYSDNALDAILYGNPSGFSPTRVEAELVVYVTELRGVSNVVEPEEPEVELLGKEIDECATVVGAVKVGDQHVIATTEIAAPAGFGKVYKYVEVREAFHGSSYSDLCLTDYSVVTFAIKATKMRMNSDWDESNEWLVFTMTQTSEAFWTIEVTKNGEVIHTATEVNGTRDDANYPYNTLASILYGKSDYVAWNVGGTVTMYVTELRDISNVEEPEKPEVELIGEEISECAATLGALEIGDQQFSASTEVAAPAGFENVYKYVEVREAFHGGNYSNICLTDYATVTFAVKATKMKLNGDWDESNEWLVFTMTQTSEAVWTIVVTKNGEMIHTTEGVSGSRDGGAYAYNALDAILYGGAPEFVAWNVDGTVTMYITELRGVLPEANPQ